MTTIGERISKCRREKNLSQEYIAEMLGVTRQAVSKWENNITEPDTSNLIALSRLFGVSVEYLASGEDTEPRITYIEKKIPTLKIIGIVLIALGGLCAVLSVLAPFMLAIGIASVALGILLVALRRDGLILGGVMLALGVVLFIVQGFTGGIDTPVMCLIVLIAVGLPLLVYAVIKAARVIKKNGERIGGNPRAIRRLVIAATVCVAVIGSVAITAGIVIRNRRDRIERAMWFSPDRLSEYMIAGLLAPSGVDCVNLNGEKLLFDFEGEEYTDYLSSVHSFLKRKGFKYLGTRGGVLVAKGEEKKYELIIPGGFFKPEHGAFSQKDDINDYRFVYSNSQTALDGEVECFIIYFNYVEPSTAVIGGREFKYNVEMTVSRESIGEGYKFRSYEIEYNTRYYDLFLPDQPTEAMDGKEVRIRTRAVIGMDMELRVNGVPASLDYKGEEYWEFSFVMPAADVVLEMESVCDDPLVPPSMCIGGVEDWLLTLTADGVTELRTERTNASVMPLRNFYDVRRTFDKDIITEVIKELRYLEIMPLGEDDGGYPSLDGGGVLNFIFVLSDGSEGRISFVDGYYKGNDGTYYEVCEDIFTLDACDPAKAPQSLRLSLWEQSHTAYTADGDEIGRLIGLSEVEFTEYGGSGFGEGDYLYYVETERGRLNICADRIFVFDGVAYELTDGSLFDIIGVLPEG